MVIHVIQHGLVDLHSHYFNETLAWRQTLSDAGVAFRSTATFDYRRRCSGKLERFPAFRLAPDSRMEVNPSLRPAG